MGDRANVCVLDYGKENVKDRVFLYTHGGGSELHKTLATALARNIRWEDSAYLARIIFDAMTDLRGEETGYGISSGMPDNSYPILMVDCVEKAVYVSAENDLEDPAKWRNGLTFQEYIETVNAGTDPREA